MPKSSWGRWKEGAQPFPRERAEGVFEYLAASLKTTPPPPPKAVGMQVPKSRITTEPPEPTLDTSDETRLRHSAGMSYWDLLAIRRGQLAQFTDGVVFPTSTAEVERWLSFAQRNDLAVVTWGGGTSVVGGVTPLRGAHRGTLTISLRKMTRMLSWDARTRLVSFECGVLGPQLEKELARVGFTLGHFPQSFEISTLGGWLAARSSGQASSLYQEPAARLRGATVVTPLGTLRWDSPVEDSTGPRSENLFLGSEGTLGIFTEATVEAFPLPEATNYRGLLFSNWDQGLECLRELVQSEPTAAVVRLSDPEETSLSVAGRAPTSGLNRALEKGYLKAKGARLQGGCLGIVGFEGTAVAVRRAEKQVDALAKANSGVDLGSGVGESWKRDRFLVPSLRDDLMDRGWMVETLETGAAWPALVDLYRATIQSLRRKAGDVRIPLHASAHLSHATPAGGCLYFTLIAPQPPEEFKEPLQSLKETATEAILAHGGTLSHHHGIGTLHRKWVARAATPTKALLMQTAKRTLDPTGMLNPSKLYPHLGGDE